MPRLTSIFAAVAFAVALLACVATAFALSNRLEQATLEKVTGVTGQASIDWITVNADGLRVVLSGEAPDEAARFKAVTVAARVVAPDRIEDRMTVRQPDGLAAPQFSLELLRNGDGISLIGLIPAATGRDSVLDEVHGLADRASVTDMLETADHPVPDHWDVAVGFALEALRELPRSKISVTATRVEITAISDSPEEKLNIETGLARAKPDGIDLVTHITAPRPVITPFTLRFIIDHNGGRFDSCSANNDATRQRIAKAAIAAGHVGKVECSIGLGAPTPRWAEAAELSIGALRELGGGTVTMSDADISLIASDDTAKADFDRIVHALEQALPDVFSVHAVLPPKIADGGTGAAREVPEFLATLSPEGLVQMNGRVPDARAKAAIAAYAQARFGASAINDATRVDETIADGWPIRVLAALEALSQLHNGKMIVTEDAIEVSGSAADPDARTRIAQILSSRVGESETFRLNVAYVEALDPQNQLPTPAECVQRINAALLASRIQFASGSAKIAASSAATLDAIADIMRDCNSYAMEIGGHTDSQGRDSMNLTLSQARAEAVLDALLAREVLTSNLSAKGFGESSPIADNETEEGRAANRRIEFQLIEPKTEPPADDGTPDSATPEAGGETDPSKETANE